MQLVTLLETGNAIIEAHMHIPGTELGLSCQK